MHLCFTLRLFQTMPDEVAGEDEDEADDTIKASPDADTALIFPDYSGKGQGAMFFFQSCSLYTICFAAEFRAISVRCAPTVGVLSRPQLIFQLASQFVASLG